MKSILVITDHSPEAENASLAALRIAQRVNANIIILHAAPFKKHKRSLVYKHNHNNIAEEHQNVPVTFFDTLVELSRQGEGFKPLIKKVQFNTPEAEIGHIVAKDEVWMVVVGLKASANAIGRPRLNKPAIQSIINKVSCPVIIIPQSCTAIHLERIVYMTDLRYCRLDIVKLLSKLATCFDANLILAHVAIANLPDMDERYAVDKFENEVHKDCGGAVTFFTHIKERDLKKAANIMIDVMQTDMIAFANHRFHFKELIGEHVSGAFLCHLPIPLIIFPV